MNVFNRDNVVEVLRNNIAKVTFTKVDGTERIMSCTLRPEYIPVAATTNGSVVVRESNNGNTISVWDTEANGWRSFRISSVKSLSIG